MSNASQIKKLIKRYHIEYDEYSYTQYMLSISKTDSEKLKWEDELYLIEDYLLYIESDIIKLKPSKYMIDNYTELKDIME